MRDTLAVIHSRKSVRKYLEKPLTLEILETLLKAGMAAPSAGNRKPWAFVAVTQRETLVRLAAGLHYGKMVQHAAAAIAVCGVLAKALPDKERDFWVQDCAAAAQNILLAAEAMGLGAVWGGIYPLMDRVTMVQSVLGLPTDVLPLNIISLGYPADNYKAKDKFDPACIHWETWQPVSRP
jgi:nitroreductase